MSNFEKIIITLFDVIIICVMAYGVVNGNNWGAMDMRIVTVTSLVVNLVLVEYMLYVVSGKRGVK